MCHLLLNDDIHYMYFAKKCTSTLLGKEKETVCHNYNYLIVKIFSELFYVQSQLDIFQLEFSFSKLQYVVF